MERHFADQQRTRRQEAAFSPAQELQFELMKLASFNALDGLAVVRDLRRHPNLWVAALMERFDATDRLITLRDLPQGHWNADTLLLLTYLPFMRCMEVLASAWHPTTVDWPSGKDSASLLGVPVSTGLRVLRAWWD